MLAIICSFYLVIIFPHWYSIYTELCRGGDCKEVLRVSEVIQVLICSFRQRDGRRLLSPAALSFYQRPHASKFALIHVHVRVFVCVRALLEAVKLLIHSQQSQITVSSLIRKCGRHLNILVFLCSPQSGLHGQILYFTRQRGFLAVGEHSNIMILHETIRSTVANALAGSIS